MILFRAEPKKNGRSFDWQTGRDELKRKWRMLPTIRLIVGPKSKALATPSSHQREAKYFIHSATRPSSTERERLPNGPVVFDSVDTHTQVDSSSRCRNVAQIKQRLRCVDHFVNRPSCIPPYTRQVRLQLDRYTLLVLSGRQAAMSLVVSMMRSFLLLPSNFRTFKRMIRFRTIDASGNLSISLCGRAMTCFPPFFSVASTDYCVL